MVRPPHALAIVLSLVALAGRQAAAACGDLNVDGNINGTDLAILNQCSAGSCPTLPAPGVCGTGDPLDCGNVVDEVGPAVIDAVDEDALRIHITGGDPLFDLCEGPGPEIDCPGNAVTIGDPPLAVTGNQTWPADCAITIDGLVTVEGAGTVLTIEAGTVIRGDGTLGLANPAALVFEQGTRIDAVGSAAAPIVFTSVKAPGSRGKGDWGGVMFNGRGTVNTGGCTWFSEGVAFPFGGCQADYNGGRARFVRVEMGGLDFSFNNELNLWTMNALGTQTEFAFIMAVNGDDDCFEWFGGTLAQHHLVAAACGDDAFDWQLGFTGSLQYGLYLQSGQQTDTGGESRGVEADNSEFDQDGTPISNPELCNLTLVGGANQPGANSGSDSGILLRRGTYGQIANALVTAFADSGVELRDVSTTDGACVDGDADGSPESLTGNLIVRHSILADCGSGGTEMAKNGDTLDADDATQAETGPCDTGAAPGCACDSESWYAHLVSGFSVANANGVAATVDFDNAAADLEQYPADDNTQCTAAGVPSTCCTGAGTGTCRALWDARHVITLGAAPAAFDCKSLNPTFASTAHLGGVNPAAACTTTGAGAQCDWLEKPWTEFNIN
jgi:hypothetical protein